MNVFIQLTSAGTFTGPFSLYSDMDGYTSPFQSNISKIKLLNGFLCTLVPTSTTIIRILSTGDACRASVDVTLEPEATTTTSTTGLPIQVLLVGKAVAGTDEFLAATLCGELYNSTLTEIETVQVVYFQSASPIPIVGQLLFTNTGLTVPFIDGANVWWAGITEWNLLTTNTYDYVLEISSLGEVLSTQICSGITTTTTSTSSTTTTTTTAIPQYHVEMCVNATTYDQPNEESIPYILSPVLVNTPTKAGYNYLFFSIPVARTFTIKDSLGADVTSDFALDTASGTSGVDARVGYYPNFIYRSSSVYSTNFSLNFTITLS